MRRAHANILEAIGGTPLVKLCRLGADVDANFYVKCEFMNPGGSMKDRMTLHLVNQAEKRGELQPGGTIVEATSGNTGAGLAMIAAVRGYQCVFVMPDKMSEEKIASLRAFGARVVVCPTAVDPEDPRSYYSVAKRITEETEGAYYSNQYHNPDNPGGHYISTGPELWEDTDGQIDVFVTGMGTGGTMAGVGRYLRERNPYITLLGVDPVGSLYYDYVKNQRLTKAFTYKVEGIGEDFIPTTFDTSLIDDIVRVDDRECFLMARELVRQEGLYAGGSSGAAVAGAIKWARDHGRGQNIVILLPDGAAKYLSKVFNDEWLREHGFLDLEAGLGSVANLIGTQTAKVITVQIDEQLRDVIETMTNHGVSQLPVMAGDELKGVVAEVDLLRHLASGEYAIEDTVETLVEGDYASISLATPIETLQGLLADASCALVLEEGKLHSVITRIDLIEFFARRHGSRGRRS